MGLDGIGWDWMGLDGIGWHWIGFCGIEPPVELIALDVANECRGAGHGDGWPAGKGVVQRFEGARANGAATTRAVERAKSHSSCARRVVAPLWQSHGIPGTMG